MDKDKILDEIFENDPDGILEVKPRGSSVKTPEERKKESLQEINDFIEKHGREPEANTKDIYEYQLHSRLKHLKDNQDELQVKESTATYGDSYSKVKEINTIDDIFEDDSMNILNDEADDIFKFRHTPKEYERAVSEFVASRQPCRDFEKYEEIFKTVQKEITSGKRKLVEFVHTDLKPGDFFVHSGILLYLESVNFEQEVQEFKSGTRLRTDGRTKCIFENGTESNMLYRSLYKALLANGRSVTENIDKINEGLIAKFSNITEEDEEAGYIYVLKSKSTDEKIISIENLYKIGFSNIDIEQRIKNSEREPTYLMAPVKIVGAWKCYNMNAQKFELLIHNFFGKTCLGVDVFDEKGNRHTPREWFIVPLKVIEQAIGLIITGEIVNYRYDPENQIIVNR